MFNPIFLTDEYFTNFMLPADDGDDLGGGDSTNSPAPTVPDAPILSGQPAAAPAMPISGGQDPSQVAAPAPAASQAPDNPAVFPSDEQAPAMPVSGGTNPANVPLPRNSRPTVGVGTDNGMPTIIPQAAGTPSPWKQLVLGALIGMTAGGRNFAQGEENGGAKVQAMQDQQAQAAQDQQKLAFASVQAAHQMIQNRHEAIETDQAEENLKEQQENHAAQTAAYMTFFGVGPSVQFNSTGRQDGSTKATAGLGTISQQSDDGKIPRVAMTVNPNGENGSHDYTAYAAPNAAQLAANPNGNLALVNEMRRAQGKAPLDDSAWRTGEGTIAAPSSVGEGPKALSAQTAYQSKQVADAQQFFISGPPLSKTGELKKDTQANAVQLQELKNNLANYEANPNADGKVASQTIAQLQSVIDKFGARADAAKKAGISGENDVTTGEAPAEAQAAAQKAAATIVAENTGAAENAKVNAKAREAQVEQSVKEGDPVSAGNLLSQRLTTISELKSRGMTPEYITKAIQQAQKNDPNYNAVVEDNNAKVAGNEQNVQFFGSAGSLVDKDGTLDQLQQAGGQISQHDWQILNKTKNWKDLQTGDAGISGYAATAVGVADDYAKVMGGGTGSDTSRALVLQSVNPNASPAQRAAAVAAMRNAVDSQMRSRIGTNSFLQKGYGQHLMVSVTDPNGGVHKFRDQASADTFKKQAGIQ